MKTMEHLPGQIKIGVILLSFLLFLGCNNDCENKVTVDNTTTNSVGISWHHSCMSCDSWEVCIKRASIFKQYKCPTVQYIAPVMGTSYVFPRLESKKKYKMSVKSLGTDLCVARKIGTVKGKTK